MSPRDRRALLTGGVMVVAAWVALRLGPWAWHWTDHAVQQRGVRMALLERTRAEVRSASALEDSAAVIRQQLLRLAPKLLAGGTGAEAVADLANRLTLVAERHQVRLEQTDAVADSVQGGNLRRVTVHSEFEGDTRGTLGVLGDLVTAPVVLVIDRVRMIAPDPGSAGTVPERLRTELTVHGWYLDREATR